MKNLKTTKLPGFKNIPDAQSAESNAAEGGGDVEQSFFRRGPWINFEIFAERDVMLILCEFDLIKAN